MPPSSLIITQLKKLQGVRLHLIITSSIKICDSGFQVCDKINMAPQKNGARLLQPWQHVNTVHAKTLAAINTKSQVKKHTITSSKTTDNIFITQLNQPESAYLPFIMNDISDSLWYPHVSEVCSEWHTTSEGCNEMTYYKWSMQWMRYYNWSMQWMTYCKWSM